MFRNVGVYATDAGELPSRKYRTVKTRSKFETKNNVILFYTYIFYFMLNLGRFHLFTGHEGA
jgi:hypothetical protein